MTFSNILVALDGSKNSQLAAEYGFWLASKLSAELTGQHVVDPRIVELFLEPEFGEELGLSDSVETSEKVFKALRRIGGVILERFAKEARVRGIEADSRLSEGYTVEEILKQSRHTDVLVVGHRAQGEKRLPANLILGSVAERLVVAAPVPVLIAVQPVEEVKQVLVAYDGSEASRGALLMAENLAKNTDSKLKAMIVIPEGEEKQNAKVLLEEGEKFLREYWIEDVFSIRKGTVSGTLLSAAEGTNSLLVLGAYGYKSPEENVLGSTTTKVIRATTNSVLIYRPKVSETQPKSKTVTKHMAK